MSPHTATDMLRAPVLSLFIRYSLPWALAMLLASSAGIVDGFFVGREAGPFALAGLNIVIPVFSLLMGLGIVIASGGAVRCAHYLGQGRGDAANAMFTKCLVSLVSISLIVALAGAIFLHPIILALGARGELVEPATVYLRTILPFFPVFVAGLGLSYFVRVDQKPVLASLGLTLSAAVNVVLDYVLIVRYGMGIRGAALASGIGFSFTFLLFGWHFFRAGGGPRLRLTRAYGSWGEVGQAAWNGISEMITEMSSGLVQLISNWVMMTRLGPYGVAALTVISYTFWCGITLAYGISDSLAPLVSANRGAGQRARVQQILRIGAGTVLGLGMICFAVLSFWPRQLVSLFITQDGPAMAVALEFMAVARFAFFCNGLNIVLTAYFTGLLLASASALVSILRSLILPVLFLLALPPFWGETGIFIALPLAEGLTFLVACLLYRYFTPRIWARK